MYLREKLQHLFQAGSQQEIAGWRKSSNKKLEDSRLVHLLLQIGLDHGELVEIREEGAV